MPEDDDALAWAGDDHAGHLSERGSRLDANTQRHNLEAEDAVRGPSSLALVGYGVFAGVYFLYSISWFLLATRSGAVAGDSLSVVMFSLGLWCAVAAAPLWFVSVLLLTDRAARRFVWLGAGALVLAPLAMVVPS